MPTYDTPDPISATIDLGLGDARIAAGDGATTAGLLNADLSEPAGAGAEPCGRPGVVPGEAAARFVPDDVTGLLESLVDLLHRF